MYDYRPEIKEEDVEEMLRMDKEYEQWLDELDAEEREQWFEGEDY